MDLTTFFKRHLFSIAFTVFIVAVSLFKAPQISVGGIEGLDKVAHFGMYFILSALIWFEQLHHNPLKISNQKLFLTTWILPIAVSGLIELLQAYCTSYRTGDVMDFLANVLGSSIAYLCGRFILSPLMLKK